MKTVTKFLFVAAVAGMMASCSSTDKMMTGPNYRLDFDKADFEYSEIVKGEATSTLILGVDWANLFDQKSASIASDRPGGAVAVALPIIGGAMDRTTSMAYYDLMRSNPNYDVILFPSTSVKRSGIPILFQKRTATVHARLGKLKN